MSEREAPPETVAQRVSALIAALPPKPGRKSRLGHISIEDFAELLGTTKARVIEWRKGDAYPDEKNRERLAAVSGGRYTADDFKGPSATENQDRLTGLEARIDAAEGRLNAIDQYLLLRRQESSDRVDDLAETLELIEGVLQRAGLQVPRAEPGHNESAPTKNRGAH